MMSYPYRPANGIEGQIFADGFCYRCKHDDKFQRTQEAEDGCSIALCSMLYEKDEAEYPPEWISDDPVGLKNPRCTAFEPL